MVESFIELSYFHDVATPALVCHKEPARASKASYWALERGGILFAPRSFFMALGIGGFHARKGPIIGALMPQRTSVGQELALATPRS